MQQQHTVVIQTNGGNQSQAVNPAPLRIKSGDTVTFSNSNSGELPNSIQITFPTNVVCKMGGKLVSNLTLQPNGAVNVSLESGSAAEANYSVNTQWQEATLTASPEIIIE